MTLTHPHADFWSAEHLQIFCNHIMICSNKIQWQTIFGNTVLTANCQSVSGPPDLFKVTFDHWLLLVSNFHDFYNHLLDSFYPSPISDIEDGLHNGTNCTAWECLNFPVKLPHFISKFKLFNFDWHLNNIITSFFVLQDKFVVEKFHPNSHTTPRSDSKVGTPCLYLKAVVYLEDLNGQRDIF